MSTHSYKCVGLNSCLSTDITWASLHALQSDWNKKSQPHNEYWTHNLYLIIETQQAGDAVSSFIEKLWMNMISDYRNANEHFFCLLGSLTQACGCINILKSPFSLPVSDSCYCISIQVSSDFPALPCFPSCPRLDVEKERGCRCQRSTVVNIKTKLKDYRKCVGLRGWKTLEESQLFMDVQLRGELKSRTEKPKIQGKIQVCSQTGDVSHLRQWGTFFKFLLPWRIKHTSHIHVSICVGQCGLTPL